RRAADLADHHDRLGGAVLREQLEGCGVVGADDGIAADADAGGLADAQGRELIDGLVGEGPAAADDTHRPALVDMAGHDADLALLSRGDDARAVGADEPRAPALQVGVDPNHVERRDALGDADDQLDPGVRRLQDRIRGAGGRAQDHGAVGAGLAHRLLDAVEEREALDGGAALPRGDAAHDTGAVFAAADRVEGAVFAHALDQDPRVLADQDAHCCPPAAATTFFAAAVMSSAAAKFRPESRSICLPFSSLLPFMR